jgi:hypothetical protein
MAAIQPLSDKRLGLLVSNWSPQMGVFRGSSSDGDVHCRMDSDWGYGVPCRVFGFNPAQAVRRGVRMTSFAAPRIQTFGWIVDELPRSARLRITIELIARPTSQMDDVAVDLNGEPVNFAVDGRTLIATVSNTAALNGAGTLRFIVGSPDRIPQLGFSSLKIQAE